MKKSSKIILFYGGVILMVIVFLAGVTNKVTNKSKVSLYKTYTERAIRGDIITADGYHLAKSYKTFSVSVDPTAIEPTKRSLFVNLFSIYSGVESAIIAQAIQDTKRVTLLEHIDSKTAKNLKELSSSLAKNKVFKPIVLRDKVIRKGIEITEEKFLRTYPYGDTLEPVIGYVKKDNYFGIVGIEKSYDPLLIPASDTILKGERDVGGNIVLNKKSALQSRTDGADVRLTVNMGIQKNLERSLDQAKVRLGAAEAMCAIVETKTGNIIALATSNRYNPTEITQADVPHIKLNVIQSVFEPGSIIKPLVLGLLFDKNRVNPYHILPGHQGKFTIGEKTITDEHPFGQLSVEETIIHSSNIGMAQLGQLMSGQEIYDGLRQLGFSQKSGVDLPFEYHGNTPTVKELGIPIYKATISYGYGLQANFMQILKAYNALANNGQALTLRLSDGVVLYDGTFLPHSAPKPTTMFKSTTAYKLQEILKKVVLYGTGTGTIIKGLSVGGKTGTAHIASGGGYANRYNSSFFGFVDDGKNRYTIGVVIREPVNGYFAAQTAVPVFKNAVLNLIKHTKLIVNKPENDSNITQ
jgi:cell division protein FtsI (penicillin-binding protein 3)